MKNSKISILILLVGVFFLASSALFAKIIPISSVEIAFYRLFFSVLIITPFAVTNKKVIKELKSLTKKQYILSFVTGILLSSHYVIWFESLNYTSIASSTVIVTLQPLFAVLFLYLFYKEKISKVAFLGIMISIIGSIIIGYADFQTDALALFGDLLALIAAALITGYFFLGENLRKELSIIPYSLLGYASSSIILLTYGLLQGYSFSGYEQSTWILLISMAVSSTLLGQMVINWVLRWIKPTTISVAILTEVIWAIIMAYVILGEVITVRQTIGILVIAVGLMIYIYRNKIVSHFKSIR